MSERLFCEDLNHHTLLLIKALSEAVWAQVVQIGFTEPSVLERAAGDFLRKVRF